MITENVIAGAAAINASLLCYCCWFGSGRLLCLHVSIKYLDGCQGSITISVGKAISPTITVLLPTFKIADCCKLGCCVSTSLLLEHVNIHIKL